MQGRMFSTRQATLTDHSHVPCRHSRTAVCFHRIPPHHAWCVRYYHAAGVVVKAASTTQGDGVPGTSVPHGTEIYSRPQLYELAFSYRNFKQETRFLTDAFKKHGRSRDVLTNVLDLGCGPGTHALSLAASGVKHVVGIELNTSMLEHARHKQTANPAAGTVSFVQGDMRDIPTALDNLQSSTSAGNLPKLGQYDMVMCLLGTLTHCIKNQDAAAVFKGAAVALAPGGVFLLELAHPGDLFDGTLIIGEGGKELWEVPQGKNGKDGKLVVEWGAEYDEFDPVTQVVNRTVSINLMKGDEVAQSIEQVVPARQFTVQEISLLADAAGLQLEALYGDLDLKVDMTHEDAYRMVAVMVKPLAS